MRNLNTTVNSATRKHLELLSSMSFRTRIKQKWKRLCTTDNVIDLLVDAFILLADVLTSPILIFVRIMKHIINVYFIDRIKRSIKWFVHKVLRIK